MLIALPSAVQQPTDRGPRHQPGATMSLYAPERHELYDGRFIIRGSRVYQVGRLNDPPPWDHMGNDARNVRPVEGEILIDVNEIENTGTFRAELDLPEGHYVVELDWFPEFWPCHNGGVAAWLFEHGDSGCGDMNWPRSVLFVAGWGYGHATLDGEPLYQGYEIHFMVTQGMCDRETLEVMLEPSTGEAGAVNPAAQQLEEPRAEQRQSPGSRGVRPPFRDGSDLALTPPAARSHVRYRRVPQGCCGRRRPQGTTPPASARFAP